MITKETRNDSYEAIKHDSATRRLVILEILKINDGMTAKEVAEELYRRGITPSDVHNYAAPRLTELYNEGKIEITGKKLCPHTLRNVAVWEIVADE